MKLPPQSESSLQKQVIDLARLHGWLVHHVRPAMTAKGYRTPLQGDTGFPDCVLLKPPRLLFVELKAEKGRLSDEQTVWLLQLKASGADARIWRPADWDEIEAVLIEEAPDA